jgi:Uma2 family endonuclease
MTAIRQPDVAPDREAIFYPESDGQPMGETELHVMEMLELRFMLQCWLRDVPDAYIGTDLFLYYVEGRPSEVVCPDVFVAFGVDNSRGPRRTFMLWEEGQPPSVVIEVTSRSTRREDEEEKRVLYARLGVAEYWLYDPEGEYLSPALQGYRLVGGTYEHSRPGTDGRLESRALGLTLGLADGRIELRDAATGERLLRPAEVYRKAEEERQEAEEQHRRAEMERRRAEEEQTRADRERRRADAAEAENERLRDEIRRLKGG